MVVATSVSTLALFTLAAIGEWGGLRSPLLEFLLVRLPLGVLVLTVLFRRVGNIAHPEQRRFWVFIGAGVAAILAAATLGFPAFSRRLGSAERVLEDGLYLAAFLLIMLASQHEPDRPPGWSSRMTALRTDRLGVMIGFPLIFSYFVVIPIVFDPAYYLDGMSSHGFRLALGGIAVGRLFYLAGSSPSRRWRTQYYLVAVALGLWFTVDLFEGLRVSGLLAETDLLLQMLFRELPFVLIIAAGLVRERVLLPERRHHIERFREAVTWRIPALNIGTASGLALIHLLVRRISPIDPSTIPPRDFVCVAGLLAMATLVVIQARSLAQPEESEQSVSLVLSDTEFAQSRRMEALGHMAGGVAHDFNNLLLVIGGYSELIRSSLGNRRPESTYVTELDAAVRRAGSITKQLLAFSRSQVLHTQSVDPRDVLAEVQRLVRPLLDDSITLEVRCDDDPGKILADPAQLVQVLLNLSINAIEAMPDGGRLEIVAAGVALETAWIDGHPASTPRECVHLKVRDSGQGMDAETRERAFEPFYTTKRERGGTGLGLATVYGIVAQGNGHVEIDSEPGRGTTFHVYLPRADDSDAAHAADRAVDSVETSGADRDAGTILLAEDDPAVRGLVLSFLQRLGYRVFEAADGVAALALFERHGDEIDAVVSDLEMPRLGGRELARAIRLRRPGIGIVFVSGHSAAGGIDEPTFGPGVTTLAKPFTLEDFARAVRMVRPTHRTSARTRRRPRPRFSRSSRPESSPDGSS